MTWGLVLSGGAALGIANAGVLEVLEREKLKPDCIAGSSMGAIVAGLYAAGLPLETIHTLASELKPFNLAKFAKRPLKGGLHGGILRQKLHDRLSPLLGDSTIADCKIPFVCIAGKIKERIAWERALMSDFTEKTMHAVEPYVFPNETPLIEAMLASSAIPVLFSPAKIDGDQFIDLVHFGPIPSRTLKQEYNPKILIATDTTPEYESLLPLFPKNWKTFLATGEEEKARSIAVCDLVIRPKMPYNAARFDKALAFWDAGKEAAEKKVDSIRALINSD